jgi:hypothetical protein
VFAVIVYTCLRNNNGSPLEAYDSEDACEVQRLVRLPDEQLKEIASRNRMIEAHTVCLPDSVDARGPKGK